MGAGGEDIMLSPTARARFPFSIECKNQERISIWKAYEQAKLNASITQYSEVHEPLLIIKRNNHEPLAVVNARYFIENACKSARSGYNPP